MSRSDCYALPKATYRDAQKSAADYTVIAANDEGFSDPLPVLRNAYGSGGEGGGKRGTGRSWKADPESLRLYDGHDGLLVRTALIRPPSYKAGKPLPSAQSPSDVAKLLAHLQYSDQEHMVVMALNASQRVHAIYEVGIGTSGAVVVRARDVVKILLLAGSAAAVVAHNHPSGDPNPSVEDVDMTQHLKTAFKCMGYTLLDHVIIGHGRHFSFHESGMMKELVD